MPKERVTGQQTDHFAEVGWERDKYVQARIYAPVITGRVDATKPAVVENVQFGPASVSLDRDGINRLIRALRKARDQAFGADA